MTSPKILQNTSLSIALAFNSIILGLNINKKENWQKNC